MIFACEQRLSSTLLIHTSSTPSQEIKVKRNTSMDEFKKTVEDIFGIPVERQRFYTYNSVMSMEYAVINRTFYFHLISNSILLTTLSYIICGVYRFWNWNQRQNNTFRVCDSIPRDQESKSNYLYYYLCFVHFVIIVRSHPP